MHARLAQWDYQWRPMQILGQKTCLYEKLDLLIYQAHWLYGFLHRTSLMISQPVWVLIIDSNPSAKVNQIKYRRLFTAFTIIYHGQSIIVFLLFKQFVLNKYFAENVDYLAVLLLFSLEWLMSRVFWTIFANQLHVKTSNNRKPNCKNLQNYNLQTLAFELRFLWHFEMFSLLTVN